MRARSHQPPGRGPLVAHAVRGSTTSKTLMPGRCRQYGDPRLLEVTEERNGPSGLRDDDDDDDGWREADRFHVSTSCIDSSQYTEMSLCRTFSIIPPQKPQKGYNSLVQSFGHLSLKPCPHWRLQSPISNRRIRRLSPKAATVAKFGDYSRQCGQGLTAFFLPNSTNKLLCVLLYRR